MNRILEKLAPSATDAIRADHMRVMALFHRYKQSHSTAARAAIVRGICMALEMHAQLEEEIFYPALRVADGPLIDQFVPQHDEMRRLIGELRAMSPGDPGYDKAFLELMRDVIHHVADEETQLLPDAERVLGYRLGELGMQMTKRRLQLMAPRTREIALTKAHTLPKGAVAVVAGALVAILATNLIRRT